MPTMVLVEDESFERSSIAKYIDWDLAGVKIIGEASNGSQGLTIILELQPDIVLTDVKMPVMDGIEMSRRVRAALPKVKIIFLSSYDDFEYARQAIDLNISACLMKPLPEGELLRAVKRAVDEINGERLEQRIQNKMQNNYTVSVNLARQAFVYKLLTGLTVCGEDAKQLGLEWLLIPSKDICLFISVYNKDNARNIDNYLENLNSLCNRECVRAINICINAGVLITLCLFGTDGDYTGRVNGVLKSFLNDKGAKNVRIEYMRGDGVQAPSDLYTAILQKGADGFGSQYTRVKTLSKQQIADEVESIINAQFHMPITLESIAKSMHFTPNYIGAVFKSVKKENVNRFLMKTRIEKASDFLKKTEATINDIAIN
jgi:YesN/AraC family two-component response regulator